MKKAFSILLSIMLVFSVCVPVFAATTVTVSLDNLDNLMPGASDAQLLNLQVQYLTYCNNLLDRDSGGVQYDSKSQAQAAAQKKLELGYISQKEYNDAVQAVTDLTSSQQTQSNQRADNLLKLRHMLNLGDDEGLAVRPADYSKINLDQLLSNISYSKDLNNWKDTFQSSDVETFQSLYNSMKLASQTYQSDKAKYDSKKASADLMQQKYNRGYISKKQADDANSELQTLSNTVAKDKNSLYTAYLQYDFMRDNGHSASSMSY